MQYNFFFFLKQAKFILMQYFLLLDILHVGRILWLHWTLHRMLRHMCSIERLSQPCQIVQNDVVVAKFHQSEMIMAITPIRQHQKCQTVNVYTYRDFALFRLILVAVIVVYRAWSTAIVSCSNQRICLRSAPRQKEIQPQIDKSRYFDANWLQTFGACWME